LSEQVAVLWVETSSAVSFYFKTGILRSSHLPSLQLRSSPNGEKPEILLMNRIIKGGSPQVLPREVRSSLACPHLVVGFEKTLLLLHNYGQDWLGVISRHFLLFLTFNQTHRSERLSSEGWDFGSGLLHSFHIEDIAFGVFEILGSERRDLRLHILIIFNYQS